MKRWYAAGLVAGMWLIIAGCSTAPPPAADTQAADEKAIRDGEVAWNADFKAKDADKIMGHYANDATLMVPGEPVAKGKDAIRASVNAMLADKNLTLSFSAATVDVGKGGDVAYTQGSYALTATNPKTNKPINGKGSYVTVYKKQAGGDWKAIEDINAPEGAAASPAAPTKKTHTKGGHKKKK
jgi:uncharacterized protein (TIGR02246 family)